jgi:hypothetical protein
MNSISDGMSGDMNGISGMEMELPKQQISTIISKELR